MKRAVIAGVLAALWIAPVAAQQKAQKVQCWTDKSGQRMCGDRIPPEYAGGQRKILQDGRVVSTVAGARTPEQLAEDERQKKLAAEQKRQAEYDQALLQTYRNSKDIVAMRDERLALIDNRIVVGEKNQANTDKALTDFRARAATLQKDGKPVPEKVAKQIKQLERDQRENQQALERARAERVSVQERFDGDLARYNKMRGLPPETGLPKPKPAEAATANAADAAKPLN